MANIKTIALNGAEIKVEIAGQNCAVRNDGTDTVYASRTAGVAAGADGVLAVPAGQSAVLRDTCGALFLLGTGSVQLVGADYDSVPFKTVSASGGSGADEVARAAISAHTGNAEIHVTEEEKSAWNAKAELADIPTSLPANGGNADTVGSKHAEDFMQQYTTSGWDLGFGTGQNVSISDFINAVAQKFGSEVSIFARVAWNDSSYCNIVNTDGSVIAFNGGFLCGKACTTDAVWQHARLLYFPGNFTENADSGYLIRYQAGGDATLAKTSLTRINDGGNAKSLGGYTVGGDNLYSSWNANGGALVLGTFFSEGYNVAFFDVFEKSGRRMRMHLSADPDVPARFYKYDPTTESYSESSVAYADNAATLQTHPASDFVLKSEYDALAARVAALEGGT